MTFIDPHQVDRYLAGELSSEERIAFERTLQQTPEYGDLIEAIQVEARQFTQRVIPDDRRIWAKVLAHTGLEQDRKERTPIVRHRFPGWGLFAGIVMSVAVIAVAILGHGTNAVLSVRHPIPVSTYATSSGERATVVLPDGSTVLLSVGTRLDVPADYLDGNRQLRVDGEAYFFVHSRSSDPFIVHANGTTVRVLGTRFAVRSYAEDGVTRVAVRDGKVVVANTVLSAAQQVQVTRAGVSQVFGATNVQFAFTDGVLALYGQQLSEIIPELNRWYNVDVRLGDSVIGNQHWEANLGIGSSADLVAMLEMTFGVRVERNGRTLTLYSRR